MIFSFWDIEVILLWHCGLDYASANYRSEYVWLLDIDYVSTIFWNLTIALNWHKEKLMWICKLLDITCGPMIWVNIMWTIGLMNSNESESQATWIHIWIRVRGHYRNNANIVATTWKDCVTQPYSILMIPTFRGSV